MKVCEKVRKKGTTTYNEVADELVAEFTNPVVPPIIEQVAHFILISAVAGLYLLYISMCLVLRQILSRTIKRISGEESTMR